MAIIFDANRKIFTIHTKHTTYQMQADAKGYLLHLYYGVRVKGTMDYLLCYADHGFSGNPYAAGMDRTYSLDALPQEYPSLGTGDCRNIALNITSAVGTECCDPIFNSYKITKGKYSLQGLPAVWAADDEAETLEIVLKDDLAQVEIHLLYGVLEDADIITRSVVIKNTGTETITVKKALSACLDFVQGDYDAISFYGRHAMERNLERVPVGHGTYRIGSRRGSSSHQYNPGVILADRMATEEAGNCYGMLFMYSGNFVCEAERDQFNQTRFQMGLGDELFDYPVKAGEEFTAPEVIMAYSDEGFSKLSNLYHNCILNHVCKGKQVHTNRPILINSWEAAYFDFNGDTIVDLAKQAAELGIDMVVMDDGWFGKRNDDNSSLGDWFVNEKKLGGTLGQLIERVNAQGVKFGIWIEPEMVNEDSDLYREHPDWALTIPGRMPIRSRNQLLLDFSRKEVREEILKRICAILDQGNIEYIKWDMNRSMADVYAGNVPYDYVLGLYDFLEKLTSRYPEILIEGCSGGGGRFDAGMMYYTPQIWCSDNTDAINRTRIQYGTSFFYPTSVVGSHVSAVPNHQTGRITSLNTRGVVAMAGTFGYEMNPALLSCEEKEEIRTQLAIYRRHQELIREGDYYRLSDPFKEDVAAWMSVAKDQSQALVSVVRLSAEGNPFGTYVKLKGLDAECFYLEETTGKVYSGMALMQAGLLLPMAVTEYEAYQFSFKKMQDAADLYKLLCNKTGAERKVISIFGGSGSGKTTMADILQQQFLADGIGCFVVHGDDYPHRIPKCNDQERELIYQKSGETGLNAYLGTPQEIDYDRINQVLANFHAGDTSIELKKVGRNEGEIWFEQTDLRDVQVLLLEWTHGGSEYLEGVDLSVYLDSTPEETKARRIRRGRDENAASAFIQLVISLEARKLEQQAKNADIIVGKDGHVYES
ncbi:alpha-galactosidase [uncultured Eubacterium sp.]|uniref:alpha-galactosidase n=1 Tax=uncultured Eubacterium sp. TaxID=165185 RepID=UPI0025E7462D|nr:alpha-galactosidase [uncultured Eubacterium sp.]